MHANQRKVTNEYYLENPTASSHALVPLMANEIAEARELFNQIAEGIIQERVGLETIRTIATTYLSIYPHYRYNPADKN